MVSCNTCEKVLKALLLKPSVLSTQEVVERNSPGEALHDGVRSVALRRSVPDMSNITNTHPHTWNTANDIIESRAMDVIVSRATRDPAR